MRYGRYGTSHWLLRFGLGITFLWIGIDIIRHPDIWIGYLPANIPLGLSRPTALQLNGIFDIALGVFFIINRAARLTSLLAVIHLAGILIFYGIDAVTIRDVGLFGTALALFFWPQHGYRKHWWQRILHRRSHESAEE